MQYHLNDSHNQAYVHWAGDHSDTIILLTRDQNPNAHSTSHVWISKDYNKLTVENRTADFNLSDGKAALINLFYASPVNNQRVGYLITGLVRIQLYYTFNPFSGSCIFKFFQPEPILFIEQI